MERRRPKVVIVGSGNAALCAAIAALEMGAEVLIVEKGDRDLAGGNSKYTAGAMRFAYRSKVDLEPLLRDPDDARLSDTEFGSYPSEAFAADLVRFNDGEPYSREQSALVEDSYDTVRWLADHGVKFDPIWDRQSFDRAGTRVFWGGLTLAVADEGVGLIRAEMTIFERLGGRLRYDCAAVRLLTQGEEVTGVTTQSRDGTIEHITADAVVLACGGFEANTNLRVEHLGPEWKHAKVRGTPLNTGDGLLMAFEVGATRHGRYDRCHATPMDLFTPDYGNLDIPHDQRKHYRKICYFLGVMVNQRGERFLDEGSDFRNYTYAQFGRAILHQPGHRAWQIFDSKVADLLYEEYAFDDAHFVEADSLVELVALMDDMTDRAELEQTLDDFNASVIDEMPFEPSILDGRSTVGITPPKSNWATRLDTPPYRAYPVTGGITFTYGGLRIDDRGAVLREDGTSISGLYACGELVGGVFFNGYPGGSGLTSGAVFGRRAGNGAGTARR